MHIVGLVQSTGTLEATGARCYGVIHSAGLGPYASRVFICVTRQQDSASVNRQLSLAATKQW